MDPLFWKKTWENGEINFHRDRPHPQLVEHFQHLKPGKVMVPLCGKSLDLLWLKNQGHEVVGIELSSIACEAFFRENELAFETSERSDFTVYRAERITLWCGDFFKSTAEAWNGVTNLYDRAALVALPPELRQRYVQHVLSLWKREPLSQGLVVALEYPEGAIEGPPFSVSESELRTHYGQDFRIEKVSSGVNPNFEGKVTENVYRMLTPLPVPHR
jgi:thiopurine S-methyltransferase